MKIALCFSGPLRQFKEGYECLEHHVLNYWKKNNIKYDIFFHTWDNHIQYFKFQSDGGEFKEAISLYKPTDYKLEIYDDKKKENLLFDSKFNLYLKYLSQNGFDWEQHLGGKCFTSGGIMRDNHIAMFYGMKKVNEIRKEYEKRNKIKYDIVIRNRFDNIIFDKIDLDVLNMAMNDKKNVYIPIGYDPDDKDILCAVNDQFALGSPRAMDIHMNLYDKLYDYLIKRYNDNFPQPSYALGLTKYNLVENNIGIKRFYLDYIIHKYYEKYDKAGGVVTGYKWDVLIEKKDGVYEDD